MKTTLAPSGSLELTKRYNFGSKISELTSTPSGKVVFLDLSPIDEVPEKLRCISEVIADSERSSDRAAFLKEARLELAQSMAAEGPTVRSLRLSLNLSQTALAQLIGTSQSHVARIERGTENVTIQTLRKLRDALGIDMNVLDKALQRQEEISARTMVSE